jgi:hypothetical protein
LAKTRSWGGHLELTCNISHFTLCGSGEDEVMEHASALKPRGFNFPSGFFSIDDETSGELFITTTYKWENAYQTFTNFVVPFWLLPSTYRLHAFS